MENLTKHNNEEKITVVLCSNNEYILGMYQNLVKYIEKKHNLVIDIELYSKEAELLFASEEENAERWNILILNADFEKSNGIDVVQSIKNSGCSAEVFFLGEDDSLAIESFLVRANGYFVQERTTPKEFEEMLLQCIKRIQQRRRKLIKLVGNEKKVFEVEHIEYIKVVHRVISVYESNGKTSHFYESLKYMEAQLEGTGIVRIHRGYMVNIKFIADVKATEIITVFGNTIPLGEKYRKSLLDRLVQDGDIDCVNLTKRRNASVY